MKNLTRFNYFLVVSVMCSIVLFSCNKKHKQHEGLYVGTERHIVRDTGATAYSVDTTYHQEIEVNYTDKIYTYLRIVNNPNSDFYALERNATMIEYQHQNEAGYAKFSGDSLFFHTSYGGLEITVFDFKGKRN